MLVTLITATFNSAESIKSCVDSVNRQTYPEIEHIIIDGMSNDNTVEIVKKCAQRSPFVVSEPDKGIYDALNKGIRLCSGDIIGVVHSDDRLAADDVLDKIVSVFEERPQVGLVYGDLRYISKKTGKLVRYWESKPYDETDMKRGWMPPHPTIFVRRELLLKVGLYNLSYKVSADYDFIIRLFSVHKANGFYIPTIITDMKIGGASNRNLRAILLKTSEDWRIMRSYGLGLKCLLFKNFSKLGQFFSVPSK